MVLQNRVGIGGLFFNFTLKTPTKLPQKGCLYKNTRSLKNCNETFYIKKFKVFLKNCHKKSRVKDSNGR